LDRPDRRSRKDWISGELRSKVRDNKVLGGAHEDNPDCRNIGGGMLFWTGQQSIGATNRFEKSEGLHVHALPRPMRA